MPTLEVNDCELFYESQGEGEPLVFLHGLGSSTRDWAHQLQHFSKTHRCLAFDLRGSGQSRAIKQPHGPFSLQQFARDVADALRALAVGPAHVIGLSLGGMTTLQLALDAPELVRSAVVINAIASMQPRTLRERAILAARRVITLVFGPRGVSRVVAPALFPHPDQHALRETFIAQMATLDPVTYRAVSWAVMQWSVETRLGELKAPVLLLAAEHDYTPVAAKEAVSRQLANGTVRVIPGAHHAAPVEAPQVVNEMIDTWLASFQR